MGASCRHAHASGPHAHHTSSTVAGGTGKYCLLISHRLISSHHHQSRHKPSIHDSLHISHFSRARSVGRARRPLQHRRHARSKDGTFSSLAGGQQNGRFNPSPDAAPIMPYCPTCAQPILHGGLEQGTYARAPGPIYYLISDELLLLTSRSETDPHERRRGSGLWPLTNLWQRHKVTLKIIDNVI